MKIRIFNGKAESLRAIAEEWKQAAEFNKCGILVDNVDKYLAQLHLVAYSDNSDLLVQYDGDVPVGFIGIRYFESPTGNQRIANENYYYVLKKHRTESLDLFKMAKILAGLKGCDRLIMNASNLAPEMHDKICKMYQRNGLMLFETSFTCEV